MTFRYVFVAVLISAALVISAFMINQYRPAVETAQPTANFIKASGKCADCHRNETGAVVHQFDRSMHNRAGINCLDCHKPVGSQTGVDHNGFVISEGLSALNCAQCHKTEYDQFLRSRHAAPAWAAVVGRDDFTPEQIAHAEKYHKGTVDRNANALALLEGPAAINKGCAECHDIGKPNPDGSIGTCTACHSRHTASIELARTPATCGQCHMGPDHSQIEIYNESKHGVLFAAQKHNFDLTVDPKKLSTADMPIPTCSTCHMSGLDGQKVTHDTTERLSWWLFAPVSNKRPTYQSGQNNMKETCLKCHTTDHVDTFYAEAEEVVFATNDKIKKVQEIMKGLRDEGLLTPAPFDEPIEFLYFDIWHYFGRTAKHGAFMGGADFVQWHGNYELLLKTIEMEEMAAEIRAHHKQKRQEGADHAGAAQATD
ncbi:MAG: ammonia-forming cytochrome c nitrite reductase subunit c552 [Desulfobacterales bacterium]|nr:ammonia-forming cytochrome c nitrite reductase subunit c552 [Desulfobacterales bacterium]